MPEPAVTRIRTRLSFESVREILRRHCREPFTIMLAPMAEQPDDELILNVMFADPEDLTRFRAGLGGQPVQEIQSGPVSKS